jgi:hypothetical protein
MERNTLLPERPAPTRRLREVDLAEYRELLVSRRTLERAGDGRLRDRRSDEVFVLRAPADARVAESA